MKNLDPHIEILWLSDIHYHESYKDKSYHSQLKDFLDKFKHYLGNFESEFHYILLSGDIAQNGIKEDYECFFEDVLKHINETFPKAKLLVVPGNHDVSRTAVEFTQEFLTNSDDRISFFSNHKDRFIKIFEPYTLNFKLNSLISDSSSATYKDNLLYGYVFDKTNKVVFVMINSAWYSVGKVFIENYINYKLYNDKDYDVIISDIKKITSEYGFQTLGLDILDQINQIIAILDKYPDFLTVTIMHHPINWLIKSDQITLDKSNFHKIKKYTDLLLTGHEHVSVYHPDEYINNGDILHLKAGCFMDFSGNHKNKNNTANVLNPFKVESNWFSTLSINTTKRTIKQEKHFFCKDSNDWKKVETTDLKKLRKNHDFNMSNERYSHIKKLIPKNGDIIIKSRFPDSTKAITKIKIYRYDNSLIIFHPFDEIIIDHKKLKKEFNKEPFQRLYIILIDLSNNYSAAYLSRNRLEVLNNIKMDYDFKFNKFRQSFFSELNSKEVKKYYNVEFVNIILPYWEIEHLIC